MTTVFGQDFLNAPMEQLLRKSVYFGGGSYRISEDQQLAVSDFFDAIEKLENYTIVISGHTDNIGSKEYNEWLSTMRSQKVREYLIQILIPEELIHLKNFGEDSPLYDNQEHMGRLANRRVDIILFPIVF